MEGRPQKRGSCLRKRNLVKLKKKRKELVISSSSIRCR